MDLCLLMETNFNEIKKKQKKKKQTKLCQQNAIVNVIPPFFSPVCSYSLN